MRAAALGAAALHAWPVLVRAACEGVSDPNELLAQLTAAPYLRLMRPDGEGPPTQVATQLYVESLDTVDEIGGTIELSGYWRMAWTDPRLNFTLIDGGGCLDSLPLSLEGSSVKPLKSPDVWVPDLYFFTAQNEFFGSYLFRLDSDGSLYMSVRFKHTFMCNFNFNWMPFDETTCAIGLMSYTEDASQVLLGPKDDIAIEFPVGNMLTLPSWSLLSNGHTFEMAKYGTGDNAVYWHSMKLHVVLKRQSAYHLLNDVFYGILFVVMSWTSFFVARTNAPARVALSLLPVLTMVNHIRGIQESLPRSSEVTWLNSFLVISLIYNISAVLEYGVVSYLLGKEEQRAQRLTVLRELSKNLDQHHAEKSARVVRIGKVHDEFEQGDIIPSASDAEEGATLDCTDSVEEHLDEMGLLPSQKRNVEDSMKLFDPQSDGFVSKEEMRAGLRQFNIYYTAEQVTEIFGKYRVKENEGMPRGRFLMYLKSMPPATPTMAQGWLDHPPSMIVDRIFQYSYILSYAFTIGIMFCVISMAG